MGLCASAGTGPAISSVPPATLAPHNTFPGKTEKAKLEGRAFYLRRLHNIPFALQMQVKPWAHSELGPHKAGQAWPLPDPQNKSSPASIFSLLPTECRNVKGT